MKIWGKAEFDQLSIKMNEKLCNSVQTGVQYYQYR